MLTYTLSPSADGALYEQLADCLRADILSGQLQSGQRLPSKRSFAENLGVSTVTVEGAYNRLIDEGYLTSEPKRGYYVAELRFQQLPETTTTPIRVRAPQADTPVSVDLSGSRSPASSFPFSVWAHLMRETINTQGEALLVPSPCNGVRPLREAIASHLAAYRGMRVDPEQIILGAGTETLYSLLLQLLGRDRVYCLEDPGYPKIAQVYASGGACVRRAAMDDAGILPDALEACGAQVAHISPTHHFPTGITMPASRRVELLAWAEAENDRYIIEDDYDSEFRLTGRPIPSLQSIDRAGRVIYMNTFSKTLASTIRISYMVLPPALAGLYFERLSFYSCTVSTFEQYTLARFLSQGYFEKHLNRMRLSYSRLRRQLMEVLDASVLRDRFTVLERDSGLHFLLEIRSSLSDEDLSTSLLQRGVRLLPLSVYYHDRARAPAHMFLINYSSLSVADLRAALSVLEELLEKDRYDASL